MKTLIHLNLKTGSAMLLAFTLSLVLVSCSEVEDPFVDRVVSPVLLVFDEVPGYLAAGGLTSVPSVTKTVTSDNYTEPVILSLTVYELDKGGILNHTVGIDSMPAANVQITFSKRNGTTPVEVTSDELGRVLVSITWEALGVTDIESIVNATAARSISIPLLWSGAHKGQSFARYSQVVFSKPQS